MTHPQISTPTAGDGITLRPGMTLLVRVHPYSSDADLDRMKTALDEQLPDVKVVIIACDQLAAYDPNPR